MLRWLLRLLLFLNWGRLRWLFDNLLLLLGRCSWLLFFRGLFNNRRFWLRLCRLLG